MFTPRLEPGKWKALILALLVHVLLAIALIFGVQWRQTPPASMAVEVWRGVPSVSAAKPSAEAQPEETPPPPPPVKAEPRPEPKPEARPEPKSPAKPDIAVKQEKDKKTKETPKEPVKEPAKDTKSKPETKNDSRPSFEDALKREMAQLERQKSVHGERLRAEQESRQMAQLKAEQSSAARASGLAGYADKVRLKVRGNIVLPPNLAGNPSAVFMLTQLPSGEVVAIKMLKSSGVPAYDSAIERAILKSSPLPLPDDKSDFQRELKLTFCPQDDGKGCQR